MAAVIFGILVVVVLLLAFAGLHVVIYGVVIGLYVLCWRQIRSKVLRLVVPTAVVLAIALPLYWTSLLDWWQFSERRDRFGGDHYVQTIERPDGIAFRGARYNEMLCGDLCQELLLEDQVEYVESVNEIWPYRADYQKPRRYTKRVGEDACALVKNYMGDPKANPVDEYRHDFLRSRGYVPIETPRRLAADQCIVIEEIDTFTAPVVIYFWPSKRPPTPSYRNSGSTKHVDIYWRERGDDANELIAWQESASVRVLGFPPRLHIRASSGFSFSRRLVYRVAKQRDFIGKALSVSLDSKQDLTAASIPHLTATLTGGPAPLVKPAADALAELGPVARSAEPALRDQLRNPDAEVRKAAAHALKKTGANEQATLDALILVLEDEGGSVSRAVANAVGSFGPRAARALPHLIPLIRDGEVRSPAHWAVSQIGSPAVPALTKALKSDDPAVSLNAAIILGKIGAAAVPALPVLRDLARENPKYLTSGRVVGVYDRAIRDINKAIEAETPARLPEDTGAEAGSENSKKEP